MIPVLYILIVGNHRLKQVINVFNVPEIDTGLYVCNKWFVIYDTCQLLDLAMKGKAYEIVYAKRIKGSDFEKDQLANKMRQNGWLESTDIPQTPRKAPEP